jgi:23S rRNA (uracil1939-C5)-methyltransferase
MPRVTAERPAYGGLSIARLDGAVLFVKGAIPGETVDVEVDERKKDYSFGTATHIISPSADRITPECPSFGACGGCRLQHVSYKRQISLKEEVLLDCLRRVAKTEISLSPPVFGDNPRAYRHRGQFKIAGDSVGFFREKSREVVDIGECPLMIPEINGLLSGFSRLLKADRDLFRGISELHITYGDSGLALLKAGDYRGPDTDRAAHALLAAGFGGVCVEYRRGRPLQLGARHTAFDLGGLRYNVSPQSFFQGHWELNRRVVALVTEELGPLAGKRVIDLYAGAGNFSLPLALSAREVIAVEENGSAVSDGAANARINNIRNCRFIKCPAEQFNETGAVHTLILDPPRLGLAARALERAVSLGAERIVYISCNPSTFARDLKKLLEMYELESLRLVDFFPQTYHIESVAFLRLR